MVLKAILRFRRRFRGFEGDFTVPEAILRFRRRFCGLEDDFVI